MRRKSGFLKKQVGTIVPTNLKIDYHVFRRRSAWLIKDSELANSSVFAVQKNAFAD